MAPAHWRLFRYIMSIHARLNPEAQSNLDAQRRASVVTSLIIAVLSVILVVLILFFILLPSLMIKSPIIVAYSSGSEEEDPLQQKRITREVTPKPNAQSVMPSSRPTNRWAPASRVSPSDTPVNTCCDQSWIHRLILFRVTQSLPCNSKMAKR